MLPSFSEVIGDIKEMIFFKKVKKKLHGPILKSKCRLSLNADLNFILKIFLGRSSK